MLTKRDLQTLETPHERLGEKIDLLLQTGKLMQESGADSNHIVRDIRRAAQYMGIPLETLSIFITYSTVMINVDDGKQSYTSLRKANHHGVDMTILSAISKLPWRALDESYTLEEYRQELERIIALTPHYRLPIKIVAAGLACASFSVLFGGNLWDALFTAMSASAGFYARLVSLRLQLNHYIAIIVAAFVASMLAFASHFISPSPSPFYPLISSVLFIVPGIPLINCINDLLDSYLVAGASEALHTLMIVGSMTTGILVALQFVNISMFTHTEIVPTHIAYIHFFASALAALGFSILFNMPTRLLPWIGLGGVISIGVRNLLLVSDVTNIVGASFLASTTVSLIMLKLAPKCRTSPLVLAIPAVIPLIPGVLLYRALIGIFLLSQSNTALLLPAAQSGVTALLIIIGLALGIALPNLVAKRHIDHDKQDRVNLLLAKRRNNVNT